MATAVDITCMSRPRPDTLNNREPVPPPTTKGEEQPAEDGTTEDDRVVFSSWDGPLVPPLTRR